MLYPFVTLENTVVAMIMFHIYSTLGSECFESFFRFDSFVSASGFVYMYITEARIMVNEYSCRLKALFRELKSYVHLLLSNKSRDGRF